MVTSSQMNLYLVFSKVSALHPVQELKHQHVATFFGSYFGTSCNPAILTNLAAIYPTCMSLLSRQMILCDMGVHTIWDMTGQLATVHTAVNAVHAAASP